MLEAVWSLGPSDARRGGQMPPDRALIQRTRSSGEYGLSRGWGLMHREFKLCRVVTDSFVVPTGVYRA